MCFSLFVQKLKVQKMVQLSRNVSKAILICFFVSIGINGCKKDYTSVIPYVHVYFSFNPASYIELNIPGGAVSFSGIGFGGLIVFKDFEGSSTPLLAFDAACTYEVNPTIRVTVDGSGVAVCPKCKSQFILIGGGGSPVKGPAVEPLKQYQAQYANGSILVKN